MKTGLHRNLRSIRAFTLAEMLVQAFILGILSYLAFLFLRNSFQYYSFLSNKIQLAEIAANVTRQLRKDLQMTPFDNLTITAAKEDTTASAELKLAAGVGANSELIFDETLCRYEYSPADMLLNWRKTAKDQPPGSLSWHHIENFYLEKEGQSLVRLKLSLKYKDPHKTHRYTAQSTILVLTGQELP